MKNILKHMAIIALATTVAMLAGCKKENSTVTHADESNQTINHGEKQQWPYTYTGYKTYYDYRTIVDHLGRVHRVYDPHCAFPYAGTCLPEVTVVAQRGSEQNDLAILFMNFHKEGKVDSFFKEHDYIHLFPDLSEFPLLVNAIVEGKIILFERHNRLTSTHYYVGLPKDYQNDYPIGSEEPCDMIEKDALCTFVIRDLR